jgi:hypothetical protein
MLEPDNRLYFLEAEALESEDISNKNRLLDIT